MSQSNTQPDQQVSIIPLALLVCSSIGLFFLLVSWAAGGQTFFEGLYGYTTLGVLVAGFIAGLIGMKVSGGIAASPRMSLV